MHLKSIFGLASWILVRDFNILLRPEKCSKFSQFQQLTIKMREFRDCVEDVGMFDHTYLGHNSTWKNKQGSTFQARKLDRVMVNEKWLEMEMGSAVEFLSPCVFDHFPANIQIAKKEKQPPKLFSFLTFG